MKIFRRKKKPDVVIDLREPTFAELDYLIDLPTEEALAAERADRRRESVAPKGYKP